jgi:hypothetical protein
MGLIKSNLKGLVMMAAVVAISVMLISSVLVYTNTAEAKSKTGKIKVRFISAPDVRVS